MIPVGIDPRYFHAIHIDMGMAFVVLRCVIDRCGCELEMNGQDLNIIPAHDVRKYQMRDAWLWQFGRDVARRMPVRWHRAGRASHIHRCLADVR